MAARKRREGESFKEYRDNLWDEEQEAKQYRRGTVFFASRRPSMSTLTSITSTYRKAAVAK